MNRYLSFFIFAIVFANPMFIQAEVNFTGKWKKNVQQSDDPQQKFEKVMKNKNSSDLQPRPHADVRMGAPRNSEGPPGFMRFPDELTIEYNNPEMKLKGENNWQRTFYTDGRKSEREVNTPRGKGNLSTTATWEGDQLKVETQGPGGGKSTTTFEQAPNGKQLFVQIRMKPIFADEPITIRYVYDALAQSPQSQQSQ